MRTPYDLIATLAERRRPWLGDDLATMTLRTGLLTRPNASCLNSFTTHGPHRLHLTRIARALGNNPDITQLRFDPESLIADSR